LIYLLSKKNMGKSLILEEINRINFLMNFDTNKSFEDQKVTQISEQHLFEQAKPAATGVAGGVAKGAKQLTPEQIKGAKQKIQQQATQTANSIFQELMKAFDMDGDKDLKDWDGTNEGGALAAIKKIKNKETLDALNKRIAMTKQFPNLKSWLNAEMSDFDGEYGDIWNKLEKMGYAGANRNILLKVAGYTPAGVLIKGADKAIDKLRSMTFEQIMEGFREIVTGVAGTIGTLILSVIPGGQIANALIFGALFAFDIYKFGKGEGNWFDTILDGLSCILAGVGAAMAPAKGAIAGEKTAVSFFGKMAQKFPKIFGFFQKIGGAIAKGANKVVGLITQGIAWIGKTFPFLAKAVTFLKGMIGKVSGFLTAIEEGIAKGVEMIGGKVVKNLVSKSVNYLASIGKKAAGPIFAKAEAYLGQKVFMEVEKDVLKAIEKEIIKQGEGAAVDQSRTVVCGMGKKYCDTFDLVATAAAGGNALLSANTKGGKSVKTHGQATQLQGLEKTAHHIEGAKQGVEGVEKEQKAEKEAKKLYQQSNKVIQANQQIGKSVA
jgi:hypothetical protein